MRKSKKLKSSNKHFEYNQYDKNNHSKPRFIFPVPIPYLIVIIMLGLFVFLEIFFNGFVWDDQWQIIDVKNSLLIQNIPQLFTHGIVFTYRPLFLQISPLSIHSSVCNHFLCRINAPALIHTFPLAHPCNAAKQHSNETLTLLTLTILLALDTLINRNLCHKKLAHVYGSTIKQKKQ